MASIKIQLTLPNRDTGTLQKLVQWSTSSPDAILNRIATFLEGFEGGAERPGTLALSIPEAGTQATQTLTFASVVATNAFTVAGVTFTCVASGATGNQFNVGGNDTISAANAAAAVNASASAAVNNSIVATSAGAVVTIRGVNYDASANFIPVVGGTNITAGGATLAGGVRDAGFLQIVK